MITKSTSGKLGRKKKNPLYRSLKHQFQAPKRGVVAALVFGALAVSVQAAEFTETDNHKEHNFDNARVEPFIAQGVAHRDLGRNGFTFPNDSQRGGRVMKVTWKESEYDGSRNQRGHELKLQVTDDNELFSGYYMNVPKSFPDDKTTIVWQLYCWNTAGCNNWTAHLSIINNELWMTHRGACAGGTKTKILDDIPRGEDLAMQIRAILGDGTGSLRVIVNGKTEANDTNIFLGFGDFDGNRALTSVVGVKMGMYCADTANYTNNETRIIYYDNFSVVRNTGASRSWRLIDPRR